MMLCTMMSFTMMFSVMAVFFVLVLFLVNFSATLDA